MVRWYAIFALVPLTIALVVLLAGLKGLIPGATTGWTALAAIFISCLTGIPLKDSFDRRGKILQMQLLQYDFLHAKHDHVALRSVEEKCEQQVDKILGG
jgi:hypothetical protein